MCEVFVGHPLDLIKVRFQTEGSKGKSPSIVRAAVDIFGRQGIRGLYRGVSAPLVAISSVGAVTFWGYDVGKSTGRYLFPNSGNTTVTQSGLTTAQLCWASAFSALPGTVVAAPTDRIKCILQTTERSQFRGMIDCTRYVLQEGGLTSLFRGFGATLLRDVPGNIVWFGVYEVCKHQLMLWKRKQQQQQQDNRTTTSSGDDELSPMAIMMAGGLAGVAYSIVAVPADVIKSRVQTTYHGSIQDIVLELLRKEGYRALVKGSTPAILRAFPAYGACFLGMEVTRQVLK